jgi:ATP/maltotriose-dependent transcriptional regulator MalT
MIDEIHRSHERVALVIDDWHRIAAPASVAALGFLIENSCHHLQIIVTTRTQAGLPLSRMRVHDELVEIDAAALRFNVSEAQAFLADRHSLVLDAEDVANLTFTTDGWVAALQLASLSLRGSANPATLISNISGGHHAIGEFLAEKVLDSLKPALLDFLVATSVTERICGDLASELANVNRGQILLEEVESRDLFLSRLDEDDNWFQYHHLFADFLRRRLERDHPERIPVLHQSASRWFADHEMVSEAVDHALIAGDVERAVDLVEQGGIKLLERSQMATFLALIAKLPHDAVVQRSRLELIIASANLLLGDTESARFALDLVNTALQRDGFGTDEAPDLRVSADVLMASMNILEDRTDGAEALLAEAFTRPETLPQWVVSWAAGVANFVDISSSTLRPRADDRNGRPRTNDHPTARSA